MTDINLLIKEIEEALFQIEKEYDPIYSGEDIVLHNIKKTKSKLEELKKLL